MRGQAQSRPSRRRSAAQVGLGRIASSASRSDCVQGCGTGQRLRHPALQDLLEQRQHVGVATARAGSARRVVRVVPRYEAESRARRRRRRPADPEKGGGSARRPGASRPRCAGRSPGLDRAEPSRPGRRGCARAARPHRRPRRPRREPRSAPRALPPRDHQPFPRRRERPPLGRSRARSRSRRPPAPARAEPGCSAWSTVTGRPTGSRACLEDRRRGESQRVRATGARHEHAHLDAGQGGSHSSADFGDGRMRSHQPGRAVQSGIGMQPACSMILGMLSLRGSKSKITTVNGRIVTKLMGALSGMDAGDPVGGRRRSRPSWAGSRVTSRSD